MGCRVASTKAQKTHSSGRAFLFLMHSLSIYCLNWPHGTTEKKKNTMLTLGIHMYQTYLIDMWGQLEVDRNQITAIIVRKSLPYYKKECGLGCWTQLQVSSSQLFWYITCQLMLKLILTQMSCWLVCTLEKDGIYELKSSLSKFSTTLGPKPPFGLSHSLSPPTTPYPVLHKQICLQTMRLRRIKGRVNSFLVSLVLRQCWYLGQQKQNSGLRSTEMARLQAWIPN